MLIVNLGRGLEIRFFNFIEILVCYYREEEDEEKYEEQGFVLVVLIFKV